MHKVQKMTALISFALLLVGCSLQTKMSSTLDRTTTEVLDRFADIDRSLSGAAAKLLQTGLSGPEAAAALNTLCSTSSSCVDCATISKAGSIIEVQPEQYKTVAGKTIADQPQVQTMLKRHIPVMSPMFRSVENVNAVDVEYPLIDAQGEFLGAVSMLFKPDTLLRPIIEKAVKGTDFNIWVVSPDGTMLYDRMSDHIGLNLFTAELYQPFPSLLKIGRQIAAEPEGRGSYSFYKPETKERVTKEAIWSTVSLYNTAWRVVIYRIAGQ
ncbi:methyl-accepting chemotaxis protein [Prosthecochloris aestuarii DSM 271]|uniref:Methyl-accepting chemotaxis protein n=2 Tax=Chlorobiaceae TaxID=191412 RepID=B4S876_PROA2|nr:methyl-accepting chemotaxis protein [Prosthecochloris aestuarii DSM 271]